MQKGSDDHDLQQSALISGNLDHHLVLAGSVSLWLEANRLKNSQAHPHLTIQRKKKRQALSEQGFAF